MPVVAGFEHDVFVSYAHNDNLAFRGGRWVEEFVGDLREGLSPLIGSAAEVWRDPRLAGNAALWPELSNRLKKSAVLLAIVSPAYQRSDWCRRELQEFLQLHAPKRAPGRSFARVVRADKLPVDPQDLPDGLATAQVLRFYQMDPRSRYPQEFISSDGLYRTRVDKLASHIASVLASFNEHVDGKPGNGR